MITTLKTEYTVKEICEGFVYNELEGKGLLVKLRKRQVRKDNFLANPNSVTTIK